MSNAVQAVKVLEPNMVLSCLELHAWIYPGSNLHESWMEAETLSRCEDPASNIVERERTRWMETSPFSLCRETTAVAKPER